MTWDAGAGGRKVGVSRGSPGDVEDSDADEGQHSEGGDEDDVGDEVDVEHLERRHLLPGLLDEDGGRGGGYSGQHHGTGARLVLLHLFFHELHKQCLPLALRPWIRRRFRPLLKEFLQARRRRGGGEGCIHNQRLISSEVNGGLISSPVSQLLG